MPREETFDEGHPRVNPVGGSSEAARDGACTPPWLTEMIGDVDLDPCSNPRSTVRARRKFDLADGNDGLALAETLKSPGLRVFVNPPYSRGQVSRWVDAYRHADYVFLLRWDPSTAWFRRLMETTAAVWFANRRVDFVPPPGVTFSSNPYPHALFFRHSPSARHWWVTGRGRMLLNPVVW